MSMDTCVICRRYPDAEDHEGYRLFVMDPEHRYALAPLSFEEWLGLDEIHLGHRDEAKMLDLLREGVHLKEGERAWVVPVERPVHAGPDPFPFEDDMPPTFLTRLVKKTVEKHHHWVSLTVEGFGLSAREDRYVSVHVPYDLAFDSIVLRVVTLFADAVVEKQRSER